MLETQEHPGETAAARPEPALATRERITLRRALLVVLIVGAIAHLLVVGGAALVITDDSLDYFGTAFPLHQKGVFNVPAFRTPGYPLVLVLSFLIFGVNGVGVLITQHALAIGTALCLTAIAARFVKPWVAMTIGLANAVSPTYLAFASVLLTESVSVFMFVFPAYVLLCWRKRPAVAAFVAMAFVGFAVLVRPGTQVVLPFFFMAAVAAGGAGVVLSRRKRLAVVGAAAAGLLAVCGPWLAYNAKRGIHGFAQGGPAVMWVALAQQDLLDKDYPIPPEMAARYAPMKSQVGASAEMWAFIANPATTEKVKAEAPHIMKKWAYHSIASKPGAYLGRLPWVLLWQLGRYPDSGFIKDGQFNWFFGMLAFDETIKPQSKFPSTVISIKDPDIDKLGIAGHGGWVRHFYWWYQLNYPEGVPEIPLCVLNLIAGVIAIRRKDWRLMWVLLASASIIGIHVFMLLAQNRYSLPAAALWYGTSAVTLGAWFPRLRAVADR